MSKHTTFLADCMRAHGEWAEYFEKNPEAEKTYTATGEWDDANKHRELIAQYQEVIHDIGALVEAVKDLIDACLDTMATHVEAAHLESAVDKVCAILKEIDR